LGAASHEIIHVLKSPLTARSSGIDGPDLAELEAHLASGHGPPGIFGLSARDGFLAAIAAGPERVPPEEGLSMIWGGGGSPFTDEAEALRVVDAIHARLDQIVRQLEEDPNAYTPILCTTDDGAVVASEWARGFLAGVDLRLASWALLTPWAEGSRLLSLITSPLLPGWDELVGAAADGADLAVFRREEQEFIAYCVVEIERFWKRRRPSRRAF
jgi:yecA family protein